MSASVSLRNTKAEIFDAYTKLDKELVQARKDLEAQRLLTSIAEGNATVRAATDEIEPGRFAPIDTVEAPRPTRTFMQNGVLMHKVPIGFNRFAIRPVQVTQ